MNKDDLVEFDLVMGNQIQSDSLTIKVKLLVQCYDLYKANRKQKGNTMVVLLLKVDK